MAQTRIRPGDTTTPFIRCIRERFKKQKTWGWDQVKNNPNFPRPLYIGSMPYLIDREVDEYLARCALSEPPSVRPERTIKKQQRAAA